MGDIATYPEDIKKIVRYKQIYRHKFDNINEWINFSKVQITITQYEIDNWNKFITIKTIGLFT